MYHSICTEVLSGEKRICLAITEPDAGSDVQGITTEARLSNDKTHYTVHGQKKFGHYCVKVCGS